MIRDPKCDAGRRAFKILGSQTTRSDLASRREVKFTVPGADLGKLRDILDVNCRRLVHNDPISTVRSIYFGDVRLSACQANLAGVGRRQKLRLRWYDSLEPGEDFTRCQALFDGER